MNIYYKLKNPQFIKNGCLYVQLSQWHHRPWSISPRSRACVPRKTPSVAHARTHAREARPYVRDLVQAFFAAAVSRFLTSPPLYSKKEKEKLLSSALNLFFPHCVQRKKIRNSPPGNCETGKKCDCFCVHAAKRGRRFPHKIFFDTVNFGAFSRKKENGFYEWRTKGRWRFYRKSRRKKVSAFPKKKKSNIVEKRNPCLCRFFQG